MDAFYVSAELLRRPELRGQAVIVAGDGPRSVVTTASYEARQFGVRSAIPASQARRLCPDGVYLKPDFPYYRSVSAQVMAIIRRHVDQVEQMGLDEAYLELTGWPAPKAAMRRIVLEIKARTGLTASVGIGPNKLVAKVASDAEKPHGFVVLSRAEACTRFADSSCALIPGIGHRTQERLSALGIKTIAELSAAPPAVLLSTFSPNTAEHLHALACFEHSGEVSEDRKVKSESRERTFDRDVADRTELERILTALTAELGAALQRGEKAGRTVGIKIRLADFSTFTRDRTITDPVSSAAAIEPIAQQLLAAFDLAQPVRLLGVRVAGLTDGDDPPRATEEQLQLSI